MPPPAKPRRLTGLLRSSTARQAAIYFASSGLRAGLTFLTLPLLAALLDPEGFGLWSLYRTLVLFLVPLLGLSLHAAIGRSYHRLDAAEMRRLILTCLCFVAAAALLVQLLATPALLARDSLFSLPAGWLLLLPLIALLSNVTLINQNLLRQQQRPWSYAAYELIQGLLPFAAGLALIWCGMDWTALVIGLLLAGLLSAGGSLWRLTRERQVGGPLDRPLLGRTLRFTLPLVPHTLGMSVLVMADRLVLERQASAAEVGIYVVGYTLGTAPQLISLPFNNAWSPWAYRQLAQGGERGRLRIAKAIYLYGAAMGLLALAWWAASAWVLGLFFAPDYQPAAAVIGWVILGVLLFALYSTLFPLLSDAGHSGTICAVTLLAVAVNLGGCLLLVPIHGMLGAAWSTAAAYAVLLLAMLVMTQRAVPLPWGKALRDLLARRSLA